MSEPGLVTASLRRVIAGEHLSGADVESLVGQLMDGGLADVEKAALLVGLACKGETAEEIAGAARAMRSRAVRIPHALENAIDTCGTGGDGSGTFNVSTAAALVAAAAGAKVAKHGNSSISSRSGSADVLAALGVSLELDAEQLGRCLEEVGIAFLFAPKLHPAMREVMPVRKQLGVRTLFNVLGPLTNPAGATRQLMGVYDERLVDTIGQVLAELGSEHALVVHGVDGLDEITTTGATRVAEVKNGTVTISTIEPGDFDIQTRKLEQLRGGEPEHNAEQMRVVLDPEREAPDVDALRDVVTLNAGAALLVAGRSESLAAGVELARQTLASGDALTKLQQLAAFTRPAIES